MKIKTDSSHKSFSLKSITSDKIKRVAIKVGATVLIIGTLFTMSGCSIRNRLIYNEIQNYNETIMNLYYEGKLPSQQAFEDLNLTFAPIDEHFISELPRDLKSLHLEEDVFIKNLNELPYACPNLEELFIYDCHSITNFDFVKDLPNLKSFIIDGDTIGVTNELVSYLNSKGIEHNLTSYHVSLNDRVQEIVNTIITEDMTEDEKIQQITMYVMENIKYDKKALSDGDLADEYNEFSLKYALEGKGVCANYAVLTNALLEKAGVKTFVVKDSDHAYNLVCLEGKYYYIDVTNINQIPIVSKLMLKYLNTGFFYKQDPYATGLSVMSDLDDLMTPAPERFLELVKEANDSKSFIEKYGSNLYFDLSMVAGVLIGIGVIKKVKEKIY